MTEQEQKTVQKVVSVVKPAKAKKELTLEEQLQIKQVEFEQKQRAEGERLRELRKRMKEQAEEKKNNLPVQEKAVPVDENVSFKETVQEAEAVSYTAQTKREYQRNLCRKYGIKRKMLQNAIEDAKKLFVARLTTSYNSKVVVAIVDLLEFGDI